MIGPADAAEVLAKMIDGKTYGEWEFLCIERMNSFRNAVRPQDLSGLYDYKAAVRFPQGHERLWALVKAMRRTTFEPEPGSIDVRYGMIVRDNSNREAVSLFMDAPNWSVMVNDKLYHARGELAHWFNDLARTITRAL